MELGIEGGERHQLHGSRQPLYRVVMDRLVWRDLIAAAILGDTRLALQPVELTCNLVIHWLVVTRMLDPGQPIPRPLEHLDRRLLHWATVKIEIFIEGLQTLHRHTRARIGPTHLTVAFQAIRLASSTTTRVCTMMKGCLNMDPTTMEPTAVGNL